MKFLKYVYYRMYKAYEAKNDSPALRALLFLVFFNLVLLVLICLFAEETLYYTGVLSGHLFDFLRGINPEVSGLLFFVIILIYSYIVYGRKNISYYEELFKEKELLNSHIKVWMLILLPFVVLFGGIFVFGVLFGGEFLGEKFVGLLCK